MKNFIITLLILVLCSATFSVQVVAEDIAAGTESTATVKKEKEGHSFLVGTLLYVPNRVMDLLDIFRLRVRVGPGVAVGARVTKLADVYAGSYASVYAGLPGPRLKPTIPFPVGLESHNGATLSLADATIDGGIGPDYSSSEIGFGFQFLFFGFDFGIDPVEVADFATGLVTVDIRDDDL